MRDTSKNERIGQVLNEILRERVNAAVLTVDLDGNIITMNKATEIMYDFPRELAIGKSFLGCLAEHEHPRFLLTHNYVVRTEKPFRGSGIELVTRANKTIYINAYSSLIKGSDGQKLGVAMITEDVTENKKMEKLVKRVDRMSTLGELALGLSHQIRTPLGTIKALASLIRSDTIDSNVIKYLKIIIEEVDRLDDLTRELLDFSGGLFMKLEHVSINEVLSNVVQLIKLSRPDSRINIRLDFEEELPVLTGDRALLNHAFTNLLLNAMEAIESEGEVVISTAYARNKINIKIKDSGKGIEPDAIEKIFHPFYTDKEHGTGLGLAVVQRVVTEHEGTLTVESELGRGTLFTVSLPIHKREA